MQKFLLVVGILLTGYAASIMWEVRASLQKVAQAITSPTGPYDLMTKQDPMQRTGSFEKTVNETLITMNWTWDGTPADWRRILADWAVICSNLPPGGQ